MLVEKYCVTCINRDVMSRIGKQPITIPKGVTITFSKENNTVTVKGPKGELHQSIDPDFKYQTGGWDFACGASD